VPRPKQRTTALRERGLAAALAVLAEDGVTGLTTRAVARRAGASVPAVYEVFGDKAGLIREIFIEGFRMLGADLSALPANENPLDALKQLAQRFRRFVVRNPVLAQVMFSRPFADFDPTADEAKAAVTVRRIFVRHVRTAVDAGVLTGEPTDVALVFFTVVEGLAAAENAQQLGSSKQSVDRRWRLALTALLRGFSTESGANAGHRSGSRSEVGERNDRRGASPPVRGSRRATPARRSAT
jgi:AcrR family transcriptional regulator